MEIPHEVKPRLKGSAEGVCARTFLLRLQYCREKAQAEGGKPSLWGQAGAHTRVSNTRCSLRHLGEKMRQLPEISERVWPQTFCKTLMANEGNYPLG